MSTELQTTAERLVDISADARRRGQRCELVNGEVRFMSPAGWYHGEIVSTIQALIATFVRNDGLGKTFGAETGFIVSRDPDTVIAPDFAFIATENLPAQRPSEAYWPGPPDFAIEVLSPSDSKKRTSEKTQAWLAAGVKLLWVIDAEAQAITVHQAQADPVAYGIGQVIDGIDLLPGFSLSVDDVFA